MIIQKYGCKLVRLTEDKIELVRQWRNSTGVSMYMEFKGTITPDMQIEWFKKINNNQNYFFIGMYKDDEIGLLNLKDVDYGNNCAEAGIYIANNKYLNSHVSFRLSYTLSEFAFGTLKLNYLNSHVLSDNTRAIKFNKTFGFELQPNQTDVYNQHYILTKENYYKNRDFITRIL